MESLLERQVPADGERDQRQIEWYLLRTLLEQGRVQRRIHLPDFLKAIAYSPTKEEVAVVLGTDHSIALIDATTGKIRQRFDQGNRSGWRADSVDFSPDGTKLAYISADPKIIRL